MKCYKFIVVISIIILSVSESAVYPIFHNAFVQGDSIKLDDGIKQKESLEKEEGGVSLILWCFCDQEDSAYLFFRNDKSNGLVLPSVKLDWQDEGGLSCDQAKELFLDNAFGLVAGRWDDFLRLGSLFLKEIMHLGNLFFVREFKEENFSFCCKPSFSIKFQDVKTLSRFIGDDLENNSLIKYSLSGLEKKSFKELSCQIFRGLSQEDLDKVGFLLNRPTDA